MPAWSPAIANAFIRMAAADGKAFDQMHLQELVYIAHGWCLAITRQPLTGDRPEAFTHGPEYRRLAEGFASMGLEPVRKEIGAAESSVEVSRTDAVLVDARGITADEHAIMAKVYAEYGDHQTSKLAALTHAPDTPWAHVFAGGAGKGHDIPHELIRVQFALIAGI